MPPAFAQVLRVLSRDWQTTTEILEKLGRLQKTALCNRLAGMLRENLVERRLSERSARMHEWRIA